MKAEKYSFEKKFSIILNIVTAIVAIMFGLLVFLFLIISIINKDNETFNYAVKFAILSMFFRKLQKTFLREYERYEEKEKDEKKEQQ